MIKKNMIIIMIIKNKNKVFKKHLLKIKPIIIKNNKNEHKKVLFQAFHYSEEKI